MKKTVQINKKTFIDFNLIKQKTMNSWFDCYAIKYVIYSNEETITNGDVNILSLKDVIFGKTDLCIKFIHSTSYKQLENFNYKKDLFGAIRKYEHYVIKMFIGN